MPVEDSGRVVDVVPYDESWAVMYRDEEKILRDSLGKGILEMHHIGSTAIPGMWAKPVVDILVVVRNIDEVDSRNKRMTLAGYEAKGEFGIRGRRFFIKGGNKRSHHVHVFQKGSSEIKRHLDFRDFMIAHPESAARYAELKRFLAARFKKDIDAYCDGKDSFIKAIDAEASDWSKGRK